MCYIGKVQTGSDLKSGGNMMPGMNSKQMKMAMQRMGMKQEEIDAKRVIIETNESRLVFEEPQGSKVNMMGQETYQLSGNVREESIDSTPELSEDDIKTVMDQAGVSEDKAKKAIEDSKGDLAEAILNLQEQ